MPITSPPPTASQRAPRSAPPAGILPPAGRITCPGPQKTPTTCREILVALGVPPASSGGVPPSLIQYPPVFSKRPDPVAHPVVGAFDVFGEHPAALILV